MASVTQLRELIILADSLKNTTGGGTALLKGTAVKIKAATSDEMEQATGANDPIYGVLRRDVPDGEYGEVVVLGRAIAKAGGALTVGGRVTAGSGGKFADASANNSAAGVCRSKGGDADNDYFELVLAGPGTGAHGA